MRNVFIYLLLILVVFTSCGRWKVTRLKSDELCTVNTGSLANNIMLHFDESQILDVSFNVFINKNNVYLSDNILKKLLVLDKKGELVLSIDSVKKIKSKDDKSSYFNFNVIGNVTVDSENNIYVENIISSTRNQSQDDQNINFTPSYILKFDERGNLLYTLGQTGSADIPFNAVESLYIDKDDRLFVTSRSFDTWSIFCFSKKKKELYVTFSKNDFKENAESAEFTGIIENIKILANGQNLILSVAFYKDLDFKYRKLFEYSLLNKKVIRTLLTIPEPRNELYTVVDDQSIYLWDVDSDKIKFIVFNFNGDILNNYLIEFPETNASYRDIFVDDKTSQFYSYHVNKKGIDILEWR